MTIEHRPAIQLPWRLFVAGPTLRPHTIEISPPPPAKLGERPSIVGWSGFDSTNLTANANRRNALYIVHAANAYPKLVEALRRCADADRSDYDAAGAAETLLRELGEGA